MRVFAQHAAPRGNPRLHIRDVPLGETIRATRHAEPVRTICGATLPAGSHDVAPVTPARLAALATITPGSTGWLCQTCRDRNDKPTRTTRTGAPAMTAQKTGASPYKVGDTVVLITPDATGARTSHRFRSRATRTITRVLKASLTLDNGRRLRRYSGGWIDASILSRDITSTTTLYVLTEPGSPIDRLALAAIRRGNVEKLLIDAASRVPTSSDPAAALDELAQLTRDARVAVRNHVAAEAAHKAARP